TQPGVAVAVLVLRHRGDGHDHAFRAQPDQLPGAEGRRMRHSSVWAPVLAASLGALFFAYAAGPMAFGIVACLLGAGLIGAGFVEYVRRKDKPPAVTCW